MATATTTRTRKSKPTRKALPTPASPHTCVGCGKIIPYDEPQYVTCRLCSAEIPEGESIVEYARLGVEAFADGNHGLFCIRHMVPLCVLGPELRRF